MEMAENQVGLAKRMPGMPAHRGRGGGHRLRLFLWPLCAGAQVSASREGPVTLGKPLAIDLFCGLGGWAEGLLAEGYDVIGFDVERHEYDEHHYPAQLVIQDVLTLHGSQFREAALIVASPPCQEYSYMAMPWTRAKAKAAAIRADTTGRLLTDLNRLFDACFRIQAQASMAGGRYIPLIIENVRGAQPWVGRARWNYGSFYLWGDVPALMPFTKGAKVPGFRFEGNGSFQSASVSEAFKSHGMNWSDPAKRGQDFTRIAGTKNTGGSWFAVAHNTTSGKGQNPDGRKVPGHVNRRDGHEHTRHLTNPGEHTGPAALPSSSPRRKAASAMIAKIPLPLSRYIARSFRDG